MINFQSTQKIWYAQNNGDGMILSYRFTSLAPIVSPPATYCNTCCCTLQVSWLNEGHCAYFSLSQSREIWQLGANFGHAGSQSVKRKKITNLI